MKLDLRDRLQDAACYRSQSRYAIRQRAIESSKTDLFECDRVPDRPEPLKIGTPLNTPVIELAGTRSRRRGILVGWKKGRPLLKIESGIATGCIVISDRSLCQVQSVQLSLF